MPFARRLRRAVIAVAPLLAIGAVPPAPAATATIAGRVEISRALAARRPRFRIYAEPGAGAVPPAPPASEADERRNVVLYIERVAGGTDGADARTHAVLRQEGERFTPHVVPVVRGTTVDFINDDPLYHNVFSLSRAKEFDLGRYPRGTSKGATFDRPGVVQVFCHIHSDMSAVVLVLDNGFFATPDASGRYTIPNLPAGDYTVVAWHERIKPITHHMHVDAGQVAQLDFTIPLPAADAARER